MVDRETIASKLQKSCNLWFEGCTCHPEPHEIQRLHHYMRHVILPTYYPPAEGDTVETCLERIYDILTAQIHRAMFQRCIDQVAEGAESLVVAHQMADAVVERFPELQERLYEDVDETFNGDPAAASYDEILLTYPGIMALGIYRMAHILFELNIPLLPRMMAEYAHRVTGIDIHPGAKIGRKIMIDHGTGIVIGETAVVGNHVRIYQGVTIGALYFPRDEKGFMLRSAKRHPTIEEGVVLYAHATVLGGDTVVGHHSVIGSNAWVTSSIPPHSKVLYQTESIIRTKKGS
ncbi:serine O-acetyltransferase EpsC [Alicyclobacillus sp. SO9]|uniref:serine O-acetyltransferase EpsC n=1 Tax=Alicyclobacillus sp. SO9 TaxID=2665646 RepID=UPI0018E71902|nr:serine O-acetyltransferase EpsC [Alicyclobacillus sp. SO9]QQE78044.1 serine acetyltransferase [Alicyclobacillus sp. SO9]